MLGWSPGDRFLSLVSPVVPLWSWFVQDLRPDLFINVRTWLSSGPGTGALGKLSSIPFRDGGEFHMLLLFHYSVT